MKTTSNTKEKPKVIWCQWKLQKSLLVGNISRTNTNQKQKQFAQVWGT